MTSAPLPPTRIVLRTFLCLAISALVLVVAYALKLEKNFPATAERPPLHIPLQQLQAVAGKARPTAQGIAVESYDNSGPLHYAILSWMQSFSAQDYGLLAYELGSALPAPALKLGWRRADDKASIHSVTLPLSGETTPLTSLRDHPEWHGTIVELGIHVSSYSPDIPLELTRVTLLPTTTIGELQASVSAWQHFKGWTHFSINQLYAGLNAHKPTSVQAIAAWAGLALLLMLLWQRLSGRASVAALCSVALVPWLTLDVLWQKNLSDQLARTRVLFADKNLHERHLADQDAYIYSFAQELKASLPPEPARILMLFVNASHNIERLRLQYYLLPHNIYNHNTLPEPGLEHRVDYVIMISGNLPRGMSIQGRQLVQGRRSLPLQLVKSGKLGHLFRVEHSQITHSEEVEP